MHYTKPFTSINEQVALLKDRGLSINNSGAKHYLEHLSYYRLSGYLAPFQLEALDHEFKFGCSFDDVINLYNFDRELRLILLDGIERTEVSIRTLWAHSCAEEYGAHAYLNPSLSKKPQWHHKNISLLKSEIERSKENFIQHYFDKYNHPTMPPIWMAAEVMSLGLISRWIADLKPASICKKISSAYQVDFKVLVSFIEQLTYIRNLCAHHSRVWNRGLTKTLKIPRTKPIEIVSYFNHEQQKQRKIYNSLVMLSYLLKVISPQSTFTNRLVTLLSKHNIDTNAMGFPKDWRNMRIWESKINILDKRIHEKENTITSAA